MFHGPLMLQTLFMLFHRIRLFTTPPPKNARHVHNTCIFPAETSSLFQTSRISRRGLDRARSLCTTKMSAITPGWLLADGAKKNWKHQERRSFAGAKNTKTLTSNSTEDKHNGNTQRRHPVGVYIFIYIYIHAIDAAKERGYGCGLYNFWSPGAKRLKGNRLHIQWNSS